MNILEHHIVEIVSVEPYLAEWTRKFPDEFVSVVMVANCWGNVQTHQQTFTVNQWEQIKEQGYFMG